MEKAKRCRETACFHWRSPLLSDPTRNTAQAYGVLGLGGLFTKRWTFYIDPEGIVRHVDRKVKPSHHGGEIAAQLQALGFPRKR